ncbi:DUF2244 domain-containing protein [Pseudomarimonas salicorniae]|uniref:DUF2244 domain-containing protein n=1 Tax=Pseudomarimonas salicorniae TaxID=2933270 RepID=A0ABT0GGI4_9GAMM|nr:DUF2244 domain-containing protein [Lysobacter sp. CAU 1642]MCK7593649.1 DUF2244 domain-containing protein [Lysobacter sp. CAU 1642]
MIENFAAAGPSGEARIVIRPNRSLSLRQVRGVALGYAGVVSMISVLSWLQGNAFAPLFALLNAAVFAGCLALVWRRCSRAELIAVGCDHVRVRRLPELVDLFDAHPAWVRVDTSAGRVRICSAGCRVEVGSWLVEGERVALARALDQALGQARGGMPARQEF